MSPPRPKSIGSCRIDQTIGKGGMAEVFSGLQEPLQRPVAVKSLLPERKEDEEARERFRREALALAALQHENIVAVHDLVEKYGRLYLILEYVDGVDLASVLQGGPLPLDVALLVGAELAAALEHAHFRRVLHRDIKPSNVMLSRSGQVKLTDFGIAKDQTLDDLTREGFVVGTLNYLSPEQLGGGRADWRSDIYSLGVTLYEALAGRRPHDEPGDVEPGRVASRILTGQRRRLREVAPAVPRSVDKVIQRCLQLEPADRYQRAAELRRALERLLAAVLKGTRPARLVSFLRQRQLVSRDALTLIASDEVEAAQPVARPETVLAQRWFEASEEVAPPAGGRRLLRWVLVALVTLLLAFGTAAAVYQLAPDWTRRTLEQLAGWAGGAGAAEQDAAAGLPRPPPPR